MEDAKIPVSKCKCPYCLYVWIRTKENPPKGCPKCHRRFVGKKPIILKKIML